MPRWVWDNRIGMWTEPMERGVTNSHPDDFPAPMVMRDIPDYRSPIDGRPITSRSERREDLKRNGCVEWDGGKTRMERGALTDKYARREHALKH